ncbi:putative retrotransposon hot spot protein (RHS) [Trypanosoma cruzi]|uniref:Putative retrotransposon hot spot protein (RHS) n=1 Tax=Trypanosoma cruzi TaxID=5693 RepID=A0A2V2WK89_TRYCR|nr:putative retrotransposon hot spot protein (RHS) [Trypanosoma cruzi]RNC51998.1 putative retrotransposon hot spot (RHS) protein [Trypanosoma cruzi]
MSGRPESVQGGNVGSQASAVPQGNGRRRARPGSEGDTDQPAATHTRDEEAQRPQWTMSSSVRDILLEGSTGRTEMKLNEFIRNYFGGRDVVDTNENVCMSVFVSNPEMFINDNEILGLITASQSYQELKIEVYNRKIELDEREILLEAINRLHHEGVVSLGQWRDFKRKYTVILLARAQINTAFSQVLRGEWREAEERARRERQELGITVSSRIKYAVLEEDFLSRK